MADNIKARVFVGGISWKADEAGLSQFFASQYGPVVECKIIMDRDTGKSKGYGFVTFQDEEAAEKVKEAHTIFYMGKNMNVGDAVRKPNLSSFVPSRSNSHDAGAYTTMYGYPHHMLYYQIPSHPHYYPAGPHSFYYPFPDTGTASSPSSSGLITSGPFYYTSYGTQWTEPAEEDDSVSPADTEQPALIPVATSASSLGQTDQPR
eukprot:TRINITY_DN4927_c0_g1_i3.p1 TRINITY_DN4927_c0_g1~~TRINITY_DN4927_c0_g1_i3.p1  ORF type:complete len:205 (+),score=58.36 TRINITY_DN4927_c0_g1_i3:168-782(+)